MRPCSTSMPPPARVASSPPELREPQPTPAATTSTTSRSPPPTAPMHATKAVAITVTNVNEGPTITSAARRNASRRIPPAPSTPLTATDPDAGTTLTYSLSGRRCGPVHHRRHHRRRVLQVRAQLREPQPTPAATTSTTSWSRASDGTIDRHQGRRHHRHQRQRRRRLSPRLQRRALPRIPPARSTPLPRPIRTPDNPDLLALRRRCGPVQHQRHHRRRGLQVRARLRDPSDAGGDNIYDVKVTASDGTNTTTKDVAITVTNVNEAPVVHLASTPHTFAENAAGTVYTATATDPDAGTTLTYSLSGADAALFTIDATTGAVAFKSAPDYEARPMPAATTSMTSWSRASDGTNAATQAVAITVTNVNEVPDCHLGRGGQRRRECRRHGLHRRPPPIRTPGPP